MDWVWIASIVAYLLVSGGLFVALVRNGGLITITLFVGVLLWPFLLIAYLAARSRVA